MVPLTEDTAAVLESFARKIQEQQSQSTGPLKLRPRQSPCGLVLRLPLVLEYLRWAGVAGTSHHGAFQLWADWGPPLSRLQRSQIARRQMVSNS
jgi:hypothetical protein